MGLNFEDLPNDKRIIVMYKTGHLAYDGAWRYHNKDLEIVIDNRNLVPTGDVEWNEFPGYENICAEVWIPEDKLEEWRAEHPVNE